MKLQLPGSASAPRIDADWERGELRLSGDSYPENSFEYYAPMLDWLDAYLRDPPGPLRLQLYLKYLNTSSVKVLMDVLDALEDAWLAGHDVRVDWYLDPSNPRGAELAGEFREDCSFPFQLCEAPASGI
ncbi:biofilm regulation phosphoprotein SiaC [Massilia sp. TS11]|uniref:biofilm regulation phosphoprotein SiaC n=1 Tax=Massilia sp. TS11 TaxID=2908003 RepID=UPI001EDA9796|nr:biofilm regulation phosphoprotein SiaC [Massilia sp. TS11]MCG2583777.1 biofilm regulation phosphoprotein SiaC [Massilia sp. TS11]